MLVFESILSLCMLVLCVGRQTDRQANVPTTSPSLLHPLSLSLSLPPSLPLSLFLSLSLSFLSAFLILKLFPSYLIFSFPHSLLPSLPHFLPPPLSSFLPPDSKQLIMHSQAHSLLPHLLTVSLLTLLTPHFLHTAQAQDVLLSFGRVDYFIQPSVITLECVGNGEKVYYWREVNNITYQVCISTNIFTFSSLRATSNRIPLYSGHTKITHHSSASFSPSSSSSSSR